MLYQWKRGPCRLISDEKSKTIPVPGGAGFIFISRGSKIQDTLHHRLTASCFIQKHTDE
jgi:hypothetical protein